MSFTLFDDVTPRPSTQRSAVLSADCLYRYSLSRGWCGGGFGVLFLMLNPSTADATVDDPTIRRCVGFAKSWHYCHLTVVNLYGLRVTRPCHLWDHPDPVGPETDLWLDRALGEYEHELVVAAWGAHHGISGRVGQVVAMAAKHREQLYCLGTTRDGSPRHPLYVPACTRAQEWHPERVSTQVTTGSSHG